jgi:hypothetical protein
VGHPEIHAIPAGHGYALSVDHRHGIPTRPLQHNNGIRRDITEQIHRTKRQFHGHALLNKESIVPYNRKAITAAPKALPRGWSDSPRYQTAQYNNKTRDNGRIPNRLRSVSATQHTPTLGHSEGKLRRNHLLCPAIIAQEARVDPARRYRITLLFACIYIGNTAVERHSRWRRQTRPIPLDQGRLHAEHRR